MTGAQIAWVYRDDLAETRPARCRVGPSRPPADGREPFAGPAKKSRCRLLGLLYAFPPDFGSTSHQGRARRGAVSNHARLILRKRFADRALSRARVGLRTLVRGPARRGYYGENRAPHSQVEWYRSWSWPAMLLRQSAVPPAPPLRFRPGRRIRFDRPATFIAKCTRIGLRLRLS